MSSFDDSQTLIKSVHNISDYVRTIIPCEELDFTPSFKETLSWWTVASKNNTRLPSRKDLNPKDLFRTLPNLSLFDIIYEGPKLVNLRTRLIGTKLTPIYGEVTGKLVTDLENPYVITGILNGCQESIKKRGPVAITAKAISEDMPFMKSYALYCPLSSDGEHIDKFLIVVHFENLADSAG